MGSQWPPWHSPFLGYLFFFLFTTITTTTTTTSSDVDALLAIKASLDVSNALEWGGGASPPSVCLWQGVRECTSDGRVRKLVVEYLNLTGSLPAEPLSKLDQLRVLSFKSNAITGRIPDLSPLVNLKSLYLKDNHISGAIPESLSTLHRLKVVVLAGNRLSGHIPASLAELPRLYVLLLQENALTGKIPAFRQVGLRYFNVSGNKLSGEIPKTAPFVHFNASCFLHNPNLCGAQVGRSCSSFSSNTTPPSLSPSDDSSNVLAEPSTRKSKKRVVAIVAASVSSVVFVVACVALVAYLVMGPQRRSSAGVARSIGEGGRAKTEEREGGTNGGGEGTSGEKRGCTWEGEGLGKLVFCGGVGEMYSLEELLKASAETLGRGSVGSTYKAVMESGFIVTVKRLRDSGYPGVDEFRSRLEILGRLRHPNLVPLRAYFQAKEERLLVYDYFPNGSLFSLIHGPRASGGGKPLHWTSCLKIAEDVATGLLFLHQTPGGVIHGNLKSSNVLLGSDFESCLTDYGLVPSLRAPDSTEDLNGATSLFYRAPESRGPRKAFTPQSDIYSFGVLLLELLTGKTPFQDLVEQHGADVPQWVRSVREEETESGDEPTSGNEGGEEKLGALLNVAMSCVSQVPESRPATKDVLRMIRDARAEVLASSNSSEHSPARWSDTVQSLPREYGSEHLNFAERD